MKYKAIIEMPKGTDRRTHMAYDKNGFVDLGPIVENIPANGGIMPMHYGFIDKTLNKEDGDEVDVIVFSKNPYKTGDEVEVEILGILNREDGDHKVIARDGSEEDFDFESLSNEDKKPILDFMGYKAKIISIGSKQQALEYVINSSV